MTVYELPHATPLVTGPGGATVLWLWPQRLVVAVGARGTLPGAHPLVAVLAFVERVRRKPPDGLRGSPRSRPGSSSCASAVQRQTRARRRSRVRFPTCPKTQDH